MTAAFIFCAGIIPLVPLLGMEHFKRQKDRARKNVCLALFVLQLILSIWYILIWLKTH
ncbi:MAG: hypothetical protein IJC67_05255 [Clostridia bacterium]|nr:hypothetical protein [Clostridia bacterium]